MKNIPILIAILFISACSGDHNSKPELGSSGHPSNCRAYIQLSVDEWRADNYTTEDTMNAIERNCGTYGSLWNN
ncbi:kynureninase [Psychrobacter sp. BF1]|uniref:kynureninase n=1 Tax=Psychrobacter sp. BF1 TaxID=2821147 RepID=UPI001C4E172E|nr:kynureninase [Psychrobacter sp. BF1]